ncbi:MAG: acyl-ACP desaturase [Candidatus Campbellbacteria bacterium]|nr:acyl-ACP desaturase [Candidatus Campbellbacteria bacterium]
MIEKGFLGLYRWYMARSQEKRNWNPDKSFSWTEMQNSFSDDLITVLQGFFAVEWFVPDYTDTVLRSVRKSHGRSHFQLRWGSEEEKHADTWLNALLFSRRRTPEFLEKYKNDLRSNEYKLPWDNPLHNIVYTVFQERATQLNYLNLERIARGRSRKDVHGVDSDDVLAQVANTIAKDEVAHYHFFLEGVRLFLYYYPAQTLSAIRDVVENFAMPANEIIPNWHEFEETVYRYGIYGPREFARDVVQVVFNNLGIEGRKALARGIKETRLVPDPDGNLQQTAIWDLFDYGVVEGDVQRLHKRIARYESEIGFSEIDPTIFVPNPEIPS